MPLTAPQVTVLYTTINTLTVEWSPINAEVDRWEIHLLNEENEEFQVSSIIVQIIVIKFYRSQNV